MSELKVGDEVLPEEFREFEHSFQNYGLRITRIYKNGNVRAETDNRDAVWVGHVDGFYRPIWAKS